MADKLVDGNISKAIMLAYDRLHVTAAGRNWQIEHYSAFLPAYKSISPIELDWKLSRVTKTTWSSIPHPSSIRIFTLNR